MEHNATVHYGDSVYLRSLSSKGGGKMLDVDPSDWVVRARWNDTGRYQKVRFEKSGQGCGEDGSPPGKVPYMAPLRLVFEDKGLYATVLEDKEDKDLNGKPEELYQARAMAERPNWLPSMTCLRDSWNTAQTQDVTVFVHCMYGMNRSVITAALFLCLQFGNLDPNVGNIKKAIDHIGLCKQHHSGGGETGEASSLTPISQSAPVPSSSSSEEEEDAAVPARDQQAMQELLAEFQDVIVEDLPLNAVLGSGKQRAHIRLKEDWNQVPPAQRHYKMSHQELEQLRARLDELLSKGYIRPSSSPYAAPCLMVPKPNNPKELRLVYHPYGNMFPKLARGRWRGGAGAGAGARARGRGVAAGAPAARALAGGGGGLAAGGAGGGGAGGGGRPPISMENPMETPSRRQNPPK
ncbi:hypothetical protein CYMTET_27563 [Cymbomonas tetramitiformis]|uniref:Uncharacterized protein n=1 Tax=Cymbomonas tetramitiformis TaxID=36881 RepID=A0AAE0KWS7_9CHLO|nr:hypothetical protein CYMTET_27563 [Cymbomonas tetramitiformis]